MLQWVEETVLGCSQRPARQKPCPLSRWDWTEQVPGTPMSVAPSLTAQSLLERLQQTTTNIGGPPHNSLGGPD